MNRDIFPPVYPILEGARIRLRPVTTADIEELQRLLQDPVVVQEYWAYPTAPTLEQVRKGYLLNTLVNYREKKSITWAIELKSTQTIVGLRDLFFDDADEPLTVQGFVRSEQRRSGISKEAYSLIIDFARKIGAVGLRANTSAENFAAVSLLSSVGFSPQKVSFHEEDLRLVVEHDLEYYQAPIFESEAQKKLYVFCKMHLHGSEISVERKGHLERNGQLHPSYRVSTLAQDSSGFGTIDAWQENIAFDSDGTVIMDLENSGWVAFLDGSMRFASTWNYCWSKCVIDE